MRCANSLCTKVTSLPLTCTKCKEQHYCCDSCKIEDWNAGHSSICEMNRITKLNKTESTCPFIKKGRFLSESEAERFVPVEKEVETRYEVTKEHGYIGKGAYGKVLLVHDKQLNKHVAMKIIERRGINNPQIHKALVNEISVQKRVIHENIIRLISHAENSKRLYILMEFASKGNLFKLLRKKERFTEKESFFFFMQTCSAIHFLHSHQIMHRDIKPENLLITEDKLLKLCDFGCCARFNDKAKLNFCGTIEYMAPEVLRREMCDEKADIWSLGILLYEMLHGRAPYQGRREKSTIRQILHSKPFFGRISEDAKELIEKLLNSDPNKRPEVWEIFNSPWVKRMQKEFGIKDRVCENVMKKHSISREPIARSLIYRQQSARNMNWLDSINESIVSAKDTPLQLKIQISNNNSIIEANSKPKSILLSNRIKPIKPIKSHIDTTCESSFHSKAADKENMLPNGSSLEKLKKEILSLTNEHKDSEFKVKLENHLRAIQSGKVADDVEISYTCEEEGKACEVKKSGYRVSIEKVEKNSLTLSNKEACHQPSIYTVESDIDDISDTEKCIKRAKSFSIRLKLQKRTRV